ncbi:hypothetical protein KIPB_000577 [Kipferlia bialata]|uniref:Uncharacterized protein n=1 Tax=Kipferlia bialata TaxID=797122 RepID=A0A9K3GDK0_9EUKA|nr:hypothetical protein KIPB_000577 [Kipferlia bialata]|eukprot:g577.t1
MCALNGQMANLRTMHVFTVETRQWWTLPIPTGKVAKKHPWPPGLYIETAINLEGHLVVLGLDMSMRRMVMWKYTPQSKISVEQAPVKAKPTKRVRSRAPRGKKRAVEKDTWIHGEWEEIAPPAIQREIEAVVVQGETIVFDKPSKRIARWFPCGVSGAVDTYAIPDAPTEEGVEAPTRINRSRVPRPISYSDPGAANRRETKGMGEPLPFPIPKGRHDPSLMAVGHRMVVTMWDHGEGEMSDPDNYDEPAEYPDETWDDRYRREAQRGPPLRRTHAYNILTKEWEDWGVTGESHPGVTHGQMCRIGPHACLCVEHQRLPHHIGVLEDAVPLFSFQYLHPEDTGHV